MSSGLHVVFGTAALGRAVAEAALAAGDRVRLVNRSGRMTDPPAGAEVVAADASDAAAAAAAATGATAIHHCAAPPYSAWAQQHPPLMRGILAAGKATGAVVVNSSNAYMYDPSQGPMTETSPERPRSRKGAIRAELDAMVRAAHDPDAHPTVTVRAPDYYGPWGTTNTVYGERVFGRVLDGKRPQVFGRLDVPHTWVDVGDFGRAMVAAAHTPTTWGSVVHVPAPPPLTQREFVAMIATAAGVKVRAQAAPTTVVRMVGWFSPIMRELAEMAYQWEEPYVFDQLRPLDGLEPTPHEVGIERTVRWFRSRHQPPR